MTNRLTLAIVAGLAFIGGEPRLPAADAKGFPADDKTIVHVLNRVAFGPRTGDMEKVRVIGVQQYIDLQLHPERIPDTALRARLSGLTTLELSAREIADQYARPAIEARRERRKPNAGRDDAEAGAPKRRDPAQQEASRVFVELSEQKILRAVYSERQLQEVLTDFWFNHFNADARKGPVKFLLTEYERETIRPHVFGTFRDLLGATAQSPAMLFYLDNWQSADQQLNENYARELMELHTLGVDGGYTQKDVTEVARAFTGWTIRNPRQGGAFAFAPRMHDSGQKVVLGHAIRAGGGQDDGEQVLDALAEHPSTARFIATKLIRRFVSDTPPPALVDRVAARFRETGGDLRAVTRAVLTSPEFFQADGHGAKFKTPFEYVVSALRATSADIRDARSLVRTMQALGMPLYMCQPPTGYNDTAEAWMNTGALVARMNFAVALTRDKLPGVTVRDGLQAGRDGLTAYAKATAVRRSFTRRRKTVPYIEGANTALVLGGPDFQRR